MDAVFTSSAVTESGTACGEEEAGGEGIRAGDSVTQEDVSRRLGDLLLSLFSGSSTPTSLEASASVAESDRCLFVAEQDVDARGRLLDR